MRFVKSRLPVVCPCQEVKYPPAGESPTDWLRGGYLGLEVITIHGFIVDKSNSIPALFLRAEFIEEGDLKLSYLINRYVKYEGWELLKTVSEYLNSPVNLLLIPYGYPNSELQKFSVNDKCLYLFDDITNNSFECYKRISLLDLGLIFKSMRGRSFTRAKKLNAASTYLECSLANELTGDKNPWPGDIDGILFLRKIPRAILEYKTHNLNSPIRNERIGKYGKADWRRVNVLNVLKNKLNVPIFFIVWGPNHTEVKIQVICETEEVHQDFYTSKDLLQDKLFQLLKIY